MEIVEIVCHFINQEVIGTDKGVADSGLDGLLGGLRGSPFYFLLVLEVIKFLNIEVPPASLIYTTNDEMFFNLGSGCFCHDQ